MNSGLPLKISVAVDNTAAYDFIAEHGLAFLIRIGNMTLLFDTGQGKALAGNLKKLDCRPKDIDILVISHGHYDHRHSHAIYFQCVDDVMIVLTSLLSLLNLCCCCTCNSRWHNLPWCYFQLP